MSAVTRKSWGGLKFGDKMDPSTHERDRAQDPRVAPRSLERRRSPDPPPIAPAG